MSQLTKDKKRNTESLYLLLLRFHFLYHFRSSL